MDFSKVKGYKNHYTIIMKQKEMEMFKKNLDKYPTKNILCMLQQYKRYKYNSIRDDIQR